MTVPQSWNKYTYCLNRPFVFTDPSGQIWLTIDSINFIWIEDDEYHANRDKFKNYAEANGAIAQYGGSINCPQCKGLAIGQFVQLNADGSVTPVANPSIYIYSKYTDEEIESPLTAYPGTVRESYINDDMYGPKGGSKTFTNEKGGRTERWYGPDGKAVSDFDYGHDHNGAGDPHVHWWDWGPAIPKRGPASPIPEGMDRIMWDNGDISVHPFRTMPASGPSYLPVAPMDIPTSIPGRPGLPARPTVPLRPMVPLRPVLVP